MKYLTLNQISLVGTVINSDNQIVNVSESFGRIEQGIQSLQYHYDNFDNVNLTINVKTIE